MLIIIIIILVISFCSSIYVNGIVNVQLLYKIQGKCVHVIVHVLTAHKLVHAGMQFVCDELGLSVESAKCNQYIYEVGVSSLCSLTP